jgi:hypothetical protein
MRAPPIPRSGTSVMATLPVGAGLTVPMIVVVTAFASACWS